MDIRKMKKLSLLLILTLNLIFIGFASATSAEPFVNKEDSLMSTQHYIEVADSYIRFLNEKNLEGILSLYADNGSVEDPVGSKIVSGKARLREFYSGAVNIELTLTLTRTGPVRVAGVEAAFPFQLLMEVNGVKMVTDIIDVFRFDKEGKIVEMRAFWGPENRRPARE